MSQAQWEDDGIRRKIESLGSLPEGYEPHLDSKWELLEASLNRPQKKSAWRIGNLGHVAAGLVLLLMGAAWWLQQATEQPVAVQSVQIPVNRTDTSMATQPLVSKPTPAVAVPGPTSLATCRPASSTFKPLKKPHTVASLPVQNTQTPVENSLIGISDSSANTQAVVISNPNTPKISAIKKLKRSRRYVEYDFGNTSGPAPAPAPAVARQGVQIRLGQPVNPAPPESGKAEPAIRLRF